VLLVALLAPTGALAAAPSVALSLSSTHFRVGDTLTVGISVANPEGNPLAALFVGLVLAEGVTARFFQPDGTVSASITLTDPARFVAFRMAPPGFNLAAPVFFRFTFPATGVPPGTYRLFAALARADAIQDGRVDPGEVLALDAKPLVFSPFNTFLPFWRKPFNGEFNLYNFFDHNLPFEFTDTNGFLLTWWNEPTSGIDGHNGYDWALPTGTPLLAVANGSVVFAGPETPFFCPLLGRVVSGVTIVIQHLSPGGEPVQSAYSHVSRLDVRVGEQVVAGQQVGLSGNVGCSDAPHLHFEARRRNATGQFVRIDPYGWESASPDPWAQHPQGATSVWLWQVGQAPEIFEEVRLAPNPAPTDRAAVAITGLRIMGWQDALRPNNEFVELTLDPRFVPTGSFDLTGFRIRNNRGTSFSFPAGFTIRTGLPVRLYSGVGTNTETELFWGLAQGAWDDTDNCAHLVRPDGRDTYTLRFSSACN